MRRATRKYDDSDAKRKNSNSDKEDASEQALIHGRNVNVNVNVVPSGNPNNVSEMQHRQRKPTNNNHINNNNTSNNSTNIINNNKQTSCDKTCNDVDYHDSEVVLKDGGRYVEQLKMTTYPGSPAHSASIASSNQTEQTHCDNNSPRNNQNSSVNPNCSTSSSDSSGTILPTTVPRAPLAGHDSMNSLNGATDEEDAGSVHSAHKARVRDQATSLTLLFHLLTLSSAF